MSDWKPYNLPIADNFCCIWHDDNSAEWWQKSNAIRCGHCNAIYVMDRDCYIYIHDSSKLDESYSR